jgi:hypothetical protein
MANFVANISKGRYAEFVIRVNANDPTNSVIVLALLASSGLQAQSVLEDVDDFSALVAGATDFATNTGSGRKVLDQTGGLTVVADDTNNRTNVDAPDQTWTALANDGTGGVGALASGYDSDSTAGTDANIVFGTHHDFAITPDSSDVTAQITDLYRAS